MTRSDVAVTHAFSADVVMPIDGLPLVDASVATRQGRILEVGGRDGVLRSYRRPRSAGVLMPGLVNAHTHLQYTLFAELGQKYHAGFEEWSVACDHAYRDRAPHEDWYAAAVLGAEMALRAGTTTVADVCTDVPAIRAGRRP